LNRRAVVVGGPKLHSHCIQCRTLTHFACICTWTLSDTHHCTFTCGNVRRPKLPYVDTAYCRCQNYMLLTVIHYVAGAMQHNDGWQRNATQHAGTNRFVWHVASINVRRRSVCECCHRNHRARSTSPRYVV